MSESREAEAGTQGSGESPPGNSEAPWKGAPSLKNHRSIKVSVFRKVRPFLEGKCPGYYKKNHL